MIRVVLVDDHNLVRAGLQQLLSAAADIDVVGTAAGGRDALALLERVEADIVLMDLSMPDLDGVETTRLLTRRFAGPQVVVLTSFSDRDRIIDALGAGAVGYLLKDAEPDELVEGVRAAARGESPLAPKAARHVVAHHQHPPPTAALTDREREILTFLAAGASNEVIAHRLQIAEKTVKNHISRIFQTIGVTDRTQAALWAVEHRVDLRS